MTYNIPVLRNSLNWAPSLIRRGLTSLPSPRHQPRLVHIVFCFADHFEPKWQNANQDTERERVNRWVKIYPKLAFAHKDSDGISPKHTWFYAAEQYSPRHLEELSKLCSLNLGEIEVHLHHSNDTQEGFRQKLEKAKLEFSQHSALVTQSDPAEVAFAFIHGNFALNNSGESPQLCGVNSELRILGQAGCFADFTLPSAPHETQTSKVNSIYYAKDIPGKRKSHDRGVDVRVGREKTGDLMLIQGPLALNWRLRKWGILPRIENGCILGNNPGTPSRVDLWVQQHMHVQGRPEWIFIKIYCHGAQENDMDALLGGGAGRMYSYLEAKYRDGERYKLHYVTAREMFNIVKAAEAGMEGNPDMYRDYLIKRYRNTP